MRWHNVYSHTHTPTMKERTAFPSFTTTTIRLAVSTYQYWSFPTCQKEWKGNYQMKMSNTGEEPMRSLICVVYSLMLECSNSLGNIWIGNKDTFCNCSSDKKRLFWSKGFVFEENRWWWRDNQRHQDRIIKMWYLEEKKDGTFFQILLQEVKFVPELWISLFSTNKTLKNGFWFRDGGLITDLTKGTTTLALKHKEWFRIKSVTPSISNLDWNKRTYQVLDYIWNQEPT
jgi:hypothetical protein